MVNELHLGKHQVPSRGFRLAVAVLCLFLVATLAFAQATHFHPTQSEADHCQLCIVVHTLVPVAAAAAAIVLVQLGAPDPPAAPIVVARRCQLGLFIRPPPVSR